MPDLPLNERIAQDIVATVAQITVAGGYHNTVAAVERRKQLGRQGGDRVIVLCQDEPELAPDSNPQNGYITWLLPFWLDCYVTEIEAGDPVDKRINTIRADVELALMIDPHRSGLAIDTFIGNPGHLERGEGGQLEGIAVRVVVKCRTRLTDPNTQA